MFQTFLDPVVYGQKDLHWSLRELKTHTSVLTEILSATKQALIMDTTSLLTENRNVYPTFVQAFTVSF